MPEQGFLWAGPILCWIMYGVSSSTCLKHISIKLAESMKLAQALHHVSVPDPDEMGTTG